MNKIMHTGLWVVLVAFAMARPSAAKSDGDPNALVYAVDKAHSQITFQVRHLGISTVSGSFRDYDVNLSLDSSDLSSLEASSTIQVASLETGVDRRDAHLRSNDFFASEQYPTMSFESTEIRPLDGTQFELVGNLTIRDVTRPVVLLGEMAGPVTGAMGETRIAFQASGSISRSEYGLTWNKLTEAGGVIVSDEVKIFLDLQAVAQTEG